MGSGHAGSSGNWGSGVRGGAGRQGLGLGLVGVGGEGECNKRMVGVGIGGGQWWPTLSGRERWVDRGGSAFEAGGGDEHGYRGQVVGIASEDGQGIPAFWIGRGQRRR